MNILNNFTNEYDDKIFFTEQSIIFNGIIFINNKFED